MRHLSNISLFAAIIVLTSTPCQAQDGAPPLVTDRPDFTESTDVVGHGVIQLETGLTFERSDDASHQVTAPQVLVRVGVGPRVELRFAGDGLISQSSQAPGGRVRSTGGSDLEVGAKVTLLSEARAGAAVAVIPFLSLPTASEGFGTTGYDPGVKVAAARELPRGFSLAGNVNVLSITTGAGRDWVREASVSLAHALRGPVAAYWEAYGTLADDACHCTLNTGLTLALGGDSQLDVAVGRGVSGDAQDWFVGLGFSVRRRPE